MNMNMNFVSAPSGSGKSHNIIMRAEYLAKNNEYVLIIVPTIALANELFFKIQNPKTASYCTRIHSETHDRPVLSLKETLTKPKISGRIIITTHSAFDFLDLKKWHSQKKKNYRDSWHLIIDEIPQVVSHFDISLSVDLKQIASLIDFDQSLTDEYVKISIAKKCKTKMQNISDQWKEDDTPKLLANFARCMLYENWDTYVNGKFYKKHLDGDDGGKLSAHSIRKPDCYEGFKSVTILSALFEHTLNYKLWQKMGTAFTKPNWGYQLRYENHLNGNLIDLYWASDDTWSQNRHQKKGVPEEFRKSIQRQFGNQEFIWIANKQDVGFDAVLNVDDGSNTGFRLPNVPHGVNEYAGFDNVAIMSAYNPKPDHKNFLKFMGLTESEINTAIQDLAVYQAIMRSSIRDPESVTRKMVIVPSKETALFLSKQLPGSKMKKLDSKIDEKSKPNKRGRKRIHKDNREKQRNYNIIKKIKGLLQNMPTQISRRDISTSLRSVESCYEIPFTIIKNNVTLAIYKNKFETSPSKTYKFEKLEDFIEQLRYFQKHTNVNSKEKLPLMTTTVFRDVNSSKTKRGKDNIHYINGIWIDNDGGDLSCDKFAEIFDDIRIILFSTWSTDKHNNRWRAFIPTKTALTTSMYKLLSLYIVLSIEKQGYKHEKYSDNRLIHKIDGSKQSGADLFYVPSAGIEPNAMFFTDYSENRTSLVPIEWIERIREEFPVPELEEEPIVVEEEITSEDHRVQEALDWWQSVARAPRSDNGNFFELGRRFRLAGLSYEDIREILVQEAKYANTPEDRIRQINGIIDWLGQNNI